MKMLQRLDGFFKRNERDFSRLMENIETEDSLSEFPALSFLYVSYSVRRKTSTASRLKLGGSNLNHAQYRRARRI